MSILPPDFPNEATKQGMADLRKKHPFVWGLIIIVFLAVMITSLVLTIRQGHPINQPGPPLPSGPNPLQSSSNPFVG